MKKLLMIMLLAGTAAAAHAQTEATSVTKIKPATTPAQKVHNTFSSHKRSNGTKVKTKTAAQKNVTEANTTPDAMKTKDN